MSESDDTYGELDETPIFRALDDHGVDYVVVGGSAAILWGAQRATRDVDCVDEQSVENHQRLCDALRQMGNPRLRIEGVDDEAAAELSKQLLHPDFFARTAASTWRTDVGSIDILNGIPGLDGKPVPTQWPSTVGGSGQIVSVSSSNAATIRRCRRVSAPS